MWAFNLEPAVKSSGTPVRARKKGEQWQRALSLLSERRVAKLEPDIMGHSAGQLALPLHREMWVVKLEPEMVSHSAPISDCEKCRQRQLAPRLLCE
eukprot:3596535-Pyramimonas_sp.AAC.1